MKAAVIFLGFVALVYAVAFVVIYRQTRNQVTREETGDSIVHRDKDGYIINVTKK